MSRGRPGDRRADPVRRVPLPGPERGRLLPHSREPAAARTQRDLILFTASPVRMQHVPRRRACAHR